MCCMKCLVQKVLHRQEEEEEVRMEDIQLTLGSGSHECPHRVVIDIFKCTTGALFLFIFFPKCKTALFFQNTAKSCLDFYNSLLICLQVSWPLSNHFIYSVFRSSYTKFKSYLHYSISSKIKLKIKISAFLLFSNYLT